MCALAFLRLEDFLYNQYHEQAINLEPQGILFADVSDSLNTYRDSRPTTKHWSYHIRLHKS